MLCTRHPDGRVTVECDDASQLSSVLAAMRGDGTTAPTATSNGHSGAATTDVNPATTEGTDNWKEKLPLIRGRVTFDIVEREMRKLGVEHYDKMEVRSLLVAKRKAETGK